MNNKLWLLALPVIFLVASCKKQPVACFDASKTTVAVGETVTFTSCATDAEILEWDFADGTTANGESASHAWTTEGVYVVQLKTLSKDKKKLDKYAVAVTVKKFNRYLTGITLKSFPATKTGGGNWDDPIPFVSPTTEPDIFVRVNIPGGNWGFNTSVKGDAKAADLPFVWNLVSQNIFLPADKWNIDIRDDDSFNSSISSEAMKTFEVVNPSVEGENGKITLSADGFELELSYEIR